jgi:hypothetical protein
VIEAAGQAFGLQVTPRFAAAANGMPPPVYALRALLTTGALAVEDGRTLWKEAEVEPTRASLSEAGLDAAARLLPAPGSREMAIYRKGEPTSRRARAQGVYAVLLELTKQIFGSERPSIARAFAKAGIGAELVTADARRRARSSQTAAIAA